MRSRVDLQKGENTLKIVLELNDMHIKEPCILCGDWFILDVVEAVAYIDNDHSSVVWIPSFCGGSCSRKDSFPVDP